MESIDSLACHFEQVSNQLGITLRPPESLVNSIGRMYQADKNYSKAYSYFKFNIKNYPRSYSAFKGMGNLYSDMGDKEKADAYFKQANALKPDGKPFIKKELSPKKG